LARFAIFSESRRFLPLNHYTNYNIYNEANQLLTAHASNESITWHYLYDNYGSLTDVIPNGTTPVSGARRYILRLRSGQALQRRRFPHPR
jgi:hypothetical protein